MVKAFLSQDKNNLKSHMIAINAASPRWEARNFYSNLQQMSGNGPSEGGGLRSGRKSPLKVGAPCGTRKGVCVSVCLQSAHKCPSTTFPTTENPTTSPLKRGVFPRCPQHQVLWAVHDRGCHGRPCCDIPADPCSAAWHVSPGAHTRLPLATSHRPHSVPQTNTLFC